MSQRTRYILIIVGLNLFIGFLLFLLMTVAGSDSLEKMAFILLFIIPAMLLLQLIAGIVLALGKRRKALGQALLLSIGAILLIGLSVCGAIAF